MQFFVKEEIENQRWAMCTSCEHLSDYSLCRKCGCVMPFKVKLGWAKCPINKWSTSDDMDANRPIPSV